MIGEKYDRIDLKFCDKESEQAYNASKIRRQLALLKGVLAGGLIYVILTWTLSPSAIHKDSSFYAKKICTIAVIYITHTITRKTSLYLEYIIFFLFLFIFFVFSWGEGNLKDLSEPSIEFLNGMLLELLFLTIIIAKMCWKKGFILFSAGNILWAFRHLGFEVNYRTNYLPLINFILNWAALCIVAFFKEKSDRKRFHEILSKEFSLSCFKDLIKKFFPNPLVIAHGDTIIFKNKETQKTFNRTENNELLHCFNNIVICSDEEMALDQELITELIENEQELITLKKVWSGYGIHDANEISKMEGKLTLLDILKRSQKFLNSKKKFFKSFKGIYKCQATNNISYYDINIKNIVWKNKFVMMVIFHENEMIQKIKQLKEQSEYKDNLLATVSHDLRTPLNGVIGMLTLTIGSIMEKEIRKQLEIALHSSQYLLFMINDILDYHQISNGKLRLNFEVFSLWNTIQEISKLIKFQAKQKGLKFIVENNIPNRSKLAIIRSDPNRLKQVVLNLLGNALKFTQVGSITITLEEHYQLNEEDAKISENLVAAGKGHFVIKVSDTGIGIKPEDQQKLFKFFGKIETKTSRDLNKNGIGLGLAISQNIIKLLNNHKEDFDIKVSSVVGKGSCFSFPILSKTEDEETDEDENLNSLHVSRKILELHTNKTKHSKQSLDYNPLLEERGAMPITNKRAKILIVDDDQINIVVASSFLKLINSCSFDTAYNGLQALEKIKEKAESNGYYDIILMDCKMPVMSGFEATQLIRELVKSQVIPEMVIIACTANTSQADIDECKRSGMNDFITKPFSKYEFINKLSEYIKKMQID